MTRRLFGLLLVSALLAAAPAHARAVEFIAGGGGGYEWFDLRALNYNDLLSVDAVDATGNQITYDPPIHKYKGSYFAFDVYAGLKILAFGLMVDYRGSYTKENLSFNQLMLDLTFFIPTKKIVPFIRMGVGYVWARARVKSDDPDIELLKGTITARGLGGRVGAGIDFRLVKFFSFGVGCDVGFLYFKSDSGRSLGMVVDLLGRLTFHV